MTTDEFIKQHNIKTYRDWQVIDGKLVLKISKEQEQ